MTKRDQKSFFIFGLIVIALVIVAPFLSQYFLNFYAGDIVTGLYYRWGSEFLASGNIPVTAYPPPAIFLFALIKLFSPNPLIYLTIFGSLILLLVMAGGWLIAKIAARKNISAGKILLVYSLPLIVLFLLLIQRFDFVAIFLTIASLIFFLEKKKTAAYLFLALAVLFKIMPVVLLPLYLLWDLKGLKTKKEWLALGKNVGLAAILLLGTTLLFWKANLGTVNLHKDVGLEVETIWANAGMVSKFFGADTYTFFNNNALTFDIAFPNSELLRKAVLPFSLLLLASLLFYFWRRIARQKTEATLIQFALLLMLGSIISYTVLSPQYLLWLAPLATLYFIFGEKRKSRNVFILFLLIAILTTLDYPIFFNEVLQITPFGFALLSTRNLLLLSLFIYLLVPERILISTKFQAPRSK